MKPWKIDKRLKWGVGIAVAVAALTMCDETPTVVWPSYVQAPDLRINSNTLYWIDDQRLIFQGIAPVKVTKDGKVAVERKEGRHIWNVVTEKTESYKETWPYVRMCVSPKLNRVWYGDSLSDREFAGPPGEETLYTPRVPLEDGITDYYYFSHVRCDQVSADEFIPGRYITALHQGDGYFSETHLVYPNPAPYTILYHADLDDPGTPTPFQSEHNNNFIWMGASSSYVSFKTDTPRDGDLRGTYFLAHEDFRSANWDGPRDCMPIYWFWPGKDHRYRQVCLPMTYHWTNIGATRIGYVLDQKIFTPGSEIYTSGIYLLLYGETPFETTRLVKLFSGLSNGRLAISPNGCRIAWFSYPYHSWNQKKAKQKLAGPKIIDLCANAELIRALPVAPPLYAPNPYD